MKKVMVLFAMLVFILNIAVAQDATKPKAVNVKKVESEKIEKVYKTKSQGRFIRTEDPDNPSNYIELTIPYNEANKATGSVNVEETPKIVATPDVN